MDVSFLVIMKQKIIIGNLFRDETHQCDSFLNVLVDPANVVGYSGVHAWVFRVGASDSPGHDSMKVTIAVYWSTGITLVKKNK